MTGEVKGFSPTDLQEHAAMKVLIESADFHNKGDALVRVAQLKLWFGGLVGKINYTINPPPTPISGKKVKKKNGSK